MKKGTNLLLVFSYAIGLLTICASQSFFPFNSNVASAVYEDIYDPTVTDGVYDLPVYIDVYFDGVDKYYTDPLIPEGPILALAEDFNLVLEQRITNLALGHNYGVFTVSDGENSDIWQIELDNADTQPLTVDEFEQTAPAIYGNIIVWQDNRNGNWDLYLYDLDQAKEYQLTNNPYDQIQPHIYKNTVIWQDNRNGNWDIYMLGLSEGEEIPLVTSANHQTNPQIFGTNVIWQNLEDNGNWQIYWHSLVTTETRRISPLSAQNCNASITRDKVIWTKYEDNKWQLMNYHFETLQLQQLQGFPVYLAGPAVYDKVLLYNSSEHGDLQSDICDLEQNASLPLTDTGSIHQIFGTQLLWVSSLTDGSQQLHLGHLKF